MARYGTNYLVYKPNGIIGILRKLQTEKCANGGRRTVRALYVRCCGYHFCPRARRPFPFQLNIFRNLWAKASCVYELNCVLDNKLAFPQRGTQ